ncbi:acyltransferase family protein [Dellaglioa algida]|uniref:Acyltransferase 3 domain-containing protein n=1 Tax=Dellaglioa algida TaxID=105612 RepID=A0A5C6M8N4_9LACO|nr:acyltransferase family protein [Dellaglioa algida]MDK1719788.1 acyltransferase [Dellaglioa algida]MDK1723131.1 acyltransferase [Dellaglioa algida]MDK1739917.1 acyltransferase [Dellaglioa algida]TWW11170.1 hypothetical protein LABALGLTS371_06850 [Dellaglioa algida]
MSDKNFEERNTLIDLARPIAATMIIMIHFSEGSKILTAMSNSIDRLAVPFFMLITVYFTFKNTNVEQLTREELWKTVKKPINTLIHIWFFWTCCYLPLILIVERGQDTAHIIFLLIMSIVGGEPIFVGSWYLGALIICLSMLPMILPVIKIKGLYILSISILIILLSIETYNFWITGNGVLIDISNNINFEATFLVGFIWITTGLAIIKYNKSINFKINTIVIIFLVNLFMLLIEYGFAHVFHLMNSASLQIMLVPTVFWGFIVLLRLKQPKVNNDFLFFLQRISALMFFIQFGVREVFYMLKINGNGILTFIEALVIIIVISFLCIRIRDSKKMTQFINFFVR